jgi:hypothetical protein
MRNPRIGLLLPTPCLVPFFLFDKLAHDINPGSIITISPSPSLRIVDQVGGTSANLSAAAEQACLYRVSNLIEDERF